MGSLSSLYISQSYQSLAHLGTNNALSAGTMTILQDGLGNSLNISFDGTNISSSGNIYGANITASVINTGSFLTTSSFNSYTSSNDAKVNSLIAATGSYATTGSNTFTGVNTFEDGVIANLLQAQSAGVDGGNILIAPYIGGKVLLNKSTEVTGSLIVTQTFTASLQQGYVWVGGVGNVSKLVATSSFIDTFNSSSLVTTSSFNAYTSSTNIRLNNLETTSASVNISISNLNSTTASQATSISNLNQYTQSNNTQWTDLMNHSSSWVTTAITASSLITASFDTGTRNLIFTKGNSQTFNVNIPDVSGSNAYTTTSSFNEFTASTNQFTASATISINALNQFTSSQTSINSGVQVALAGKLNTSSFESYTSSVNSDLTSIHSTTASLNLATASFSSSINQLNIFTASQSTASIVSSITNLNSFTSSANNRLNNLETTSASVNISITNINSTTASQAISITNLNQFSQSAQSSINSLNAATSSYAISSSVAAVDAAQQSQINSLIAATGSYLTSSVPLTSLNAFTASQLTINSGYNTFTSSANQRLSSLETNSASVNISISALNTFTASQSTASIVSSITNLNTFTASAQISINALNTNSASVNTSISNLNTTTASLNSSITQLNASSASQQISINAINAASSSWITESETGSFAYINKDNSWSANQTFTNITAISASFQYVQTLYETASVIYSSGSNQFGDELSDIQTLSGSVKVQGSLTVNGTPVLTSSADVTGFVTTSSFNAYTSSNNQRVSSLETNSASVNISISNINSTTASLNSSVSNLNQFSASNLISINALNTNSASVNSSITNLNQFTASQSTASIVSSIDNLNQFSASTLTRLTNIETTTASLNSSITNINSFTQSANQRIGSLEAATSSYVTSAITASTLVTASFDNGTRNLTFTKGDASTFAVNIPDVSGSNIPDGTISSSAQITSLGFVSSSITASSLVTASVNLNTITFTKGDASTFNITVNTGSGGGGSTDLTSLNSFTQSQYVSNSYFATTGSNTFRGSQTFNQTNTSDKITINGGNATMYLELDPAPSQTRLKIANPNNPVLRFITNQTINPLYDISVTGTGNTGSLYIGTADNAFVYAKYTDNGLTNLYNKVDLSGSLSITGSLTASLTQGYAWVGNANNISTLVSTSSFGGSTINTGSFATTGSNTFTGDQTLVDAALNATSLVSTSGSLMLVAKSYTSASAHLSSSVNQVNLIFKSNNQTADTIISGSNNLFVNPAAPTTGFKRYVGNSGNIVLNAANVAQISSSMAFSPTMNNNYFGGNSVGLTMRGPVSASAWTISANNVLGTINIGSSATLNAEKLTGVLTMTGNSIQGGTLTIVANQSFLTGSTTSFTNNIIGGATTLNLSSSTAALANNIINDSAFIFTNQFYSSSLGLGSVAMNRNIIGGQGNQIIVSGSQPAGTVTATSFSDNFIGGGSNIIYGDIANARVSGTTAYHQAIRNMVFGNQLIITGSSVLSDQSSFGSTFIGRFNADDSRRNKTSDVVFAVGTGNTGARKTGFLIDSGSNTFIEGTLNVSGSTSFTGSLTATGTFTASLTQGYAWVGNASNISTLVATSSFGGALPAGVLSSSVTNFVDYSASVDSRINGIVTGTGFATTGSNTFTGNQIITGSMFVYDVSSGNKAEIMNGTVSRFPQLNVQTLFPGTIQDDNGVNILIKTNAGGAYDGGYLVVNTISGSQFTGSIYIQSGSTLPSTTGSSVLTWNASTGQVGQSPIATLISSSLSVGAFNSTLTQSGSSGVSQSMTYNNTDISNGVSIVSNSQITLANSGTYNIQFSAQLLADTGSDIIWIWLKKNGTNVSNTSTKLVLANNEADVAAWNFVVTAAASDYFELAWQNNGGHTKLLTEAAAGNYPAIPSVILTVTQVK